jgi:glycosyltransferase involved in cell wall biosynthesis
MKKIVPVSAILPTRNRAHLLKRFLKSLNEQTVWPSEIVICDASDDDSTELVVRSAQSGWSDGPIQWFYQKAERRGLAPQRNQAVEAASQTFVWFLDDDVILEPECLEQLYRVISTDDQVGGVTATIVNQGFVAPGRFTNLLMTWFDQGMKRSTYSAACVGPGYTFMPDTSPEIPETQKAEWLIGCCSMYRRAMLPSPAVPAHFEAGALGEDLAASLFVGLRHELLHVRDARCFHDSQGGDHKRSWCSLADQGLRNRYYIMTQVMGKNTVRDHLDFALMFAFSLASLLRQPSNWRYIPANIAGYIQALWKLVHSGNHG